MMLLLQRLQLSTAILNLCSFKTICFNYIVKLRPHGDNFSLTSITMYLPMYTRALHVTQILCDKFICCKTGTPRPFEKEISYSMDCKNYSCLTRPRALLGLITRPTLKGMASAGNLNHIFTGENGSEWETNFGKKNPTGHVDI